MTEPTPVEPGAQPADVVPNTPVDPAPADDIGSLPESVQKLIRDLRGEAAKHRTAGKTAAEEARKQAEAEVTNRIAKALGIAGEDEPVDPAELTAQIEDAQHAYFRQSVALSLYQVGSNLGVNIKDAMDSKTFEGAFLKALDEHDEIVGLEPGSSEFDELVEQALNAALEKYPKFRTSGQAAGPTAPRADPSQGARGGAPVPFAGMSMTQAVSQALAGQKK